MTTVSTSCECMFTCKGVKQKAGTWVKFSWIPGILLDNIIHQHLMEIKQQVSLFGCGWKIWCVFSSFQSQRMARALMGWAHRPELQSVSAFPPTIITLTLLSDYGPLPLSALGFKIVLKESTGFLFLFKSRKTALTVSRQVVMILRQERLIQHLCAWQVCPVV